MSFFATHGVYAEEHTLGNRYEVSVEMACQVKPGDRLDHTVDYAEAYLLISQRMAQPTLLLETLTLEIAEALLGLPDVQRATVRVAKANPPIGGICATAYAEISLP
jgi:dihydroneopterin aldolase